MLYTKFKGNRPAGFRGEVFWKVFTIYGHGSHLCHTTQIIWINFCSPILLRLIMKFSFDWPSGFWGDVQECGLRTDDEGGWMDDRACLYYKLTHEPKGSGELIILKSASVADVFSYLGRVKRICVFEHSVMTNRIGDKYQIRLMRSIYQAHLETFQNKNDLQYWVLSLTAIQWLADTYTCKVLKW